MLELVTWIMLSELYVAILSLSYYIFKQVPVYFSSRLTINVRGYIFG